MVELITVVVPVYNVENYVIRCVESIINQTYKHLEIILVDDGSKDKSGQICDELARKDTRIKVIHKKNGGLSDARNVGIDIARGKYLSFIDGDDDIEPNMIEKLYNTIKDNDAQISMCRMIKIEKNKSYPTREFPSIESKLVMTGLDANKLLLKDVIDCSACLKLYRIEVFDSLRFPYGKTNEDFALMYKLFYKANKVVYISDILYHYYFREQSITTSAFSLKSFDKYYNSLDMLQWVKKNCPKILSEARHHLHLQTMFLLKHLIINNLEKTYIEQYKKLKSTITKQTFYILFDKYKTIKEKFSVLVMGWFPSLYKILRK